MGRRGGFSWRNLWRQIRDFVRRLIEAFKHELASKKRTAGEWPAGTRRCVLCVEPTAPADRCPNHPSPVCEDCCALHALCDKD